MSGENRENKYVDVNNEPLNGGAYYGFPAGEADVVLRLALQPMNSKGDFWKAIGEFGGPIDLTPEDCKKLRPLKESDLETVKAKPDNENEGLGLFMESRFLRIDPASKVGLT